MEVKDLRFKYGKKTMSMMQCVDSKLTILVATYMALGKKDIGVTYGMRTKKEQEKLYKDGKSKTMNSKHLLAKETITTAEGSSIECEISNAIDICAYENGKIRWDRAYYKDIIEDMKAIVKKFGWTDINFGWDFTSLDDPFHISVKKPGDGGVK